jgi:phosphate transport system protein
MQRYIDVEYEKLRNRIIKMGSLVEEQVKHSIKSLLTGDLDLAKTVIDLEKEIDNIDVKIDKLCQRIFATTQPVASDLRFIMAALKIDNDLERVGDIAASIAGRIENIKDNLEIIKMVELDEFALHSQKMIKDAIDCFVNRDLNLAIDILRINVTMNEKNQKVFNNILNIMQKDPTVIISATNLILILRHLERLKDHATNIAEDVVFMIEGKIVKHTSLSINSEDDFNIL